MSKQKYLSSNPSLRAPRLPSWCVPFTYASVAIVLGLTLPRIEALFLPGWVSGISPSSAVALYSAIAAGMITLTGIVFSLVFVMVQFSATAYSPRLALWMSRDPLVSHAIGVFTATFLYAIAALAWVGRVKGTSVPLISGWLVVALLLASVGVFVGLVHSLSRLQIHRVLAFTGDFARQVIDVMYPPFGTPDRGAATPEFRKMAVTQSLAHSGAPRAIQSLNVVRLVELAERAGGVIEVISAVGDTLVESTPLLHVYGARTNIAEHALRKAVRTGTQRTFDQDPKYSIQLIRDIAIRALSPAINDPTTAVQALDQIEDILLRLGRRRLDIGEVRNSVGSLCLVFQVPTWDDFLDLAFSEIRSYGADSKQVMRRMKALLTDLIAALPEERHPSLKRQQRRLDTIIARSFPDIDDQREASEEDREGFGATRRHYPDSRPEVPAVSHV